jgi:polysaccharide export outer membrane protein
MAGGTSVAVRRDIQTLFDSGTAVGLSDRQLLDRFSSQRDAAAEAAFEAIVLRHGPMVLRVCHNLLGNSADAQDAFQAAFLILVRKSRSIRQLESVGGWLYGVACRVAARARVDAARRRSVEQRGGLRVIQANDPGNDVEADDAELGPVIQEEVRRLPEKYRAVVVLCYWQGMTHEQAATQLGCPLGTVRSRMARARNLLHRRLTRRGLASLAGVMAALDGARTSVSAAALQLSPVPSELIQSTVRAAARVGAGQATAQVASGATASLVQHVLWSMTKMKTCKLIAALGAVGLLVVGVSLWAQQPNQPRPRPRPGPRQQTAVQEKPRASGARKSGPAHVVEPPDLMIVEVLDALPGRPISGERLVRPDGTISLSFYGDIHVAGLTCPEIKEKIILHLQKYLTDDILGLVDIDPETGQTIIDPATNKPKLLDPKDSDRVFVDVTAYNSRNYYILGDVQFPGRLPYTGGETVLDALQFAGGLIPSADRAKIRLIRSYPRGSPVQDLPVDYEQISMGTDSSTNYQILPDDRLVVPREAAYTTQGSSAPRSQQRSAAGRSLPESQYFPGMNTDSASKQLESLRAVERHLSEVEKKLDKIIEKMDRADKKAEEKTPVKPGRNSEREPQGN